MNKKLDYFKFQKGIINQYSSKQSCGYIISDNNQKIYFFLSDVSLKTKHNSLVDIQVDFSEVVLNKQDNNLWAHVIVES